jgi:tetratricopeptide (TPR) repeat protein
MTIALMNNSLMIDLVSYLAPDLDPATTARCWLAIMDEPLPAEFARGTPAMVLVALYVQARQTARLAQFLTVLPQHYPQLTPVLAAGFPPRPTPATDYAASLMELADHYLDQAYLAAMSATSRESDSSTDLSLVASTDLSTDSSNSPALSPALEAVLLTKAGALYQEAVAIMGDQCGRQHPEYLYSLQALANCHRQLRQFAAAIDCYQEILTIRAATVGQAHSQYAQSLNDLALIYSEQGLHSLALQLSTTALAIRQALGVEHSDYINGLCHLAYLQRAAGQLSTAQVTYQRALDLTKQYHKIPNQLYNNCLQALGYLYRLQDQQAQAAACYQELATAQKTPSGQISNPIVYAVALNLWALTLTAQGDRSAARAQHQEALAIFQATAQSHYAQQTAGYLAQIDEKQGSNG